MEHIMRNGTKHTLHLSHIHTRVKWSPAAVRNKVASLVCVGWQRWINAGDDLEFEEKDRGRYGRGGRLDYDREKEKGG